MKSTSVGKLAGTLLVAAVASSSAWGTEKPVKSCAEINALIQAHDEASDLTIRITQPRMLCADPILINKNRVNLVGTLAADGRKPILKLEKNLSIPLIVIGSEKTVKRELSVNELESAQSPLNAKVRAHLENRLSQGPVLTTPRRVEFVSVKNLELDGSLEFERMEKGIDHECWGSKQCDDENDERSHVRNNGITIRGAQDILVENVDMHSTRSGGLVTEKYCVRLTLKDMKSSANFFDGFAGYETYQSLIVGASFVNNHHAGVSLDIDFSFNHFLKSKFTDNGHSGVFARWAKGNVFAEVAIDRNGTGDHAPGVFLAQNNPTDDETAVIDTLFIRSQFSQNIKGYRVNDRACVGNQIIDSSFSGNSFGNVSVADGATLQVKKQNSARPALVIESKLLGAKAKVQVNEKSAVSTFSCHMGLGDLNSPLSALNGMDISIQDVGTDWHEKGGIRTVKMWYQAGPQNAGWIECKSLRDGNQTNWAQFAAELGQNGIHLREERLDHVGKIIVMN